MTALHRVVRLDSHTWLTLKRDTAWGEQGGRCAYCHTVLARADATADHIKPRSEGGTDERKNIAAACHWCNTAKRSMSSAKFKKALKSAPPLRVITIDGKLVVENQSFLIAVQGACRRINIHADRACKRVAGCLG